MKNEGTFQYCTNCISNPICCSNFNKINAPVLNKVELEKIKQFVGKEKFYETVEENLYSIKIKEDNCVFYKNHKCTIYDNRPIDCRLYPFDIIKLEDKYYFILYLLECINSKNLEEECSKIDSIIEEVKPWINEFTDERNFTKMKDKKYKIIKEIKIS